MASYEIIEKIGLNSYKDRRFKPYGIWPMRKIGLLISKIISKERLNKIKQELSDYYKWFIWYNFHVRSSLNSTHTESEYPTRRGSEAKALQVGL